MPSKARDAASPGRYTLAAEKAVAAREQLEIVSGA
jgi:hypothetical protein